MKLSQYKEKKNHKKLAFVIVAIVFLIGGVAIGITFANFKVQKSFKVMEGNFIYEGSGDVIFAFYNGDESLTQMPQIDDKFTFEKGECDKGASVEWNKEKWAPLVMGLKETKTTCKLYFKEYPTLSEYLIELAKTKPGQLAYDGKESLGEYGTDDNNLRFFGANPYNYVTFNNENWRIIGIMNNVEDESGNIKSHVKITRGTSIGAYSWDSSDSSVNGGSGVNEWSEADIQKVLNENYYKKEAGGICYGSSGNSKTSCPKWEEIGIDEEARKMISKVKWPIGTLESWDAYRDDSTTSAVMYKAERGGKHPKLCSNTSTCNDKIERTTIWPGYVGLPSITDVEFAPASPFVDGTFGTECLEGPSRWKGSSFTCNNNDWLSRSNSWLLSPWVSTFWLSSVAGVRYNSSGWNEISENTCSFNLGIYPTIFLDSDVRVMMKDDDNYGSSSNPIQIYMKDV